MIHVFCARWGTKYSIDYVNRLYNMVKRNLRADFKFYCQTDDTNGMDTNIVALPFLDELPNSTPEKMYSSQEFITGLPRLWDRPKLNYWKPNGWGIKGQKMFFDLDLVIQNSLLPIVKLHKDKPLIGRSWWHNMNDEKKPFWIKNYGARCNGGMMMWNDEQGKPLWNDLKKNAEKIYFICTGGSDNWITYRHYDKFDHIPPKYYYSFNRGCEWPHDTDMHKHRKNKIICVFNTDEYGRNKHFQLELHQAERNYEWVQKYWQ